MKSKITFIVLFMLTFTIMHDSVMNMVQTNEHTSISHYVSSDIPSQECSDIHEVHSMFHFVGLITPYKSTFVQLQKEKTLSHDLLRYTLPYKETSYKPPIV
jgi:hypothetical protein